jgi:small subunit ribosomal protein S8
MAFNDPIAELLTKIKNATIAQHLFVDVSLSSIKLNIIKILSDRGFIKNFVVNDEKKKIRIFLKYKGRESIIHDLKRVSKPSIRKYIGYQDIPVRFGGMGINILSTSKGVIDDETARQMKVGGELLCYVW